MNIHQAARIIVDLPDLPSLGCAGLCRLLSVTGCSKHAYEQVNDMFGKLHYGMEDLRGGAWTELRFNMVALLAVTQPRDFA